MDIQAQAEKAFGGIGSDVVTGSGGGSIMPRIEARNLSIVDCDGGCRVACLWRKARHEI